MTITQLLGFPVIIYGISILKWGFDGMIEEKVDWYSTVRNFSTAIFTIILGFLMIIKIAEF